MKATTSLRKSGSPAATLELAQRMMLRCACGYLLAAVLAAALGFGALGRLDLGAIVFILLFSALLLAAGLLCSALAALPAEERQGRR